MKTIELSSYNSQLVNANADYTCVFPPAIVGNGSQVSITQAFIDSDINASYQNFPIPEDLQLKFTFGIYYMNTNENVQYTKGKKNDLYVARDAKRRLVTDTITITVPMGNYSPMELANIITKNLLQIPEGLSIQDIAKQPGSLLKVCGQDYRFDIQLGTADTAYTLANSGLQITHLHSAVVPVDDSIFNQYPVGTEISVRYRIVNGDSNTSNSKVVSFNKATGAIEIEPCGLTFPLDSVSTYDLIQIYLESAPNTFFFNQQDVKDLWTFNTQVYIGTSQFALEFEEQNSKFQFTQLHMPMYSSKSPPTPGVSVVANIDAAAAGTYIALDARSGIYFTELEPQSFWTNLGFNVESLLVVDGTNTIGAALKTPLSRGKNITSHFFGYDGVISKSYALPVVPNGVYFYDTETVLSIVADNNPLNTDGGYYLINLQGLNTSYSNDNGTVFSGIMSIASKNYNNGGYITAYGDGSIVFQNNGEPFILSSIRVQILDPITKKLVSTLGRNNSIIIQISP